jgi:predicted neuraminidase
MKLYWCVVPCILCVSAGFAQAPLVHSEAIFPPQGKHVHGSSIVETHNGDLLACWFYGSGERTADDVLVQGARKRRGEDVWSPVFVMADSDGLPDCNPVLFIDAKERLWLFWIEVVANRWEHSLLKYRRAEAYAADGPPAWSWQDVIVLKPGDSFPSDIEAGFEALDSEEGCWGEYARPYEWHLVEAAKDKAKRQRGWMTRIHPTVLPSGRILLPLYSDGYNLGLVALSDDLGETWRASRPIVGYGPIQPTIAPRKDGTLVAYMRDGGGEPARVLVSTSSDEGETWTPATDTDIPNPSSSLEIVVLDDGRWLMVCNDTENGRHRLTAILSDDEGDSWARKRPLEPNASGGTSFSYPSVIQARDGQVHMTYSRKSSGGANIQHTTLNSAWLADQ